MKTKPTSIHDLHAALDRMTWICFQLSVVALALTLYWDGSDALMFLGCALCLVAAGLNISTDYLDRKYDMEKAYTRGRRIERHRYPAL
jgi:4-hydroxybenzoate polyprenyltransferase